MTIAIIVFVVFLSVIVAIRRGVFRSLFGGSRSDDSPPTASNWEKRLIADLLDGHRRDRAEASLLAELRTISDPAPQPVAPRPAADPATSDVLFG